MKASNHFQKYTLLFLGLVTVILVLTACGRVSAGGHVEVVKAFEDSPNHLPEGVILDKTGNIFVSLGPPFFVGGGYGAVRQISSDGTETTLIEYPAGPAPAGLAVDAPGNVYYALPNPGQPDVGVYRLSGENSADRLPGTENMLVPNGLAIDKQGDLFASDSATGSIWRIPRVNGGVGEMWLQHDLLAGCEEGQVGANGIAFWRGDLLVANTFRGLLLSIPIQKDGTPGAPEIIAGTPECNETDDLFGMDGIALDVHGKVYALLVLQHKLVRIDPTDGTDTLLLSEEDGLWNPASLAFGTGDGNRQSLFIANYAVLPPEPANNLGPAVLKYDVGVAGLPIP